MKKTRKQRFDGKKKIRRFLAPVFVLAFIFTFTTGVFAYSADDYDEDETLSLSVTFSADSNIVDGAQISIYRVADIYVENYLVFYEPLIGDYTYESITAEESAEIALSLSDYVSDAYATKTTDSSGTAFFEDLEAGMYLVVLDEEYTDDAGTIFTFDPFLVSVPLATEESDGVSWTYSVESFPKSTEVTYAQVSSPKTGQLADLYIWAAAGGCALILLCVLIIVFVRKRKITS